MLSRKQDFDAFQELSPYTTPDAVPFEYRIGRNLYRGIPAQFDPLVEKRTVDSNIRLVTVTGKTPSGLTLRAECTEYKDYPAVEWVMYIENSGKKQTPVIRDWRFVGRFSGEKPVLIHGNGDTKEEDGYEWFEHAVNTRRRTIAPRPSGLPCEGAFPYMRLRFRDRCVNLAIGWSGRWKADFRTEDGNVRFEASQFAFASRLLPGERVRTPRVVMQNCAGDESRARNLWRSFYIAHIMPKENGRPLGPKMILHTPGILGKQEFCGATEENQIRGISSYLDHGLKPDIWWIDAGWYPCEDAWVNTGTWKPNPENYPDGFGKLGKFIEDNGISFLLWFEPERVTEYSEIWDEHPEFLLRISGDEQRWEGRRQALFDLGNKAALEWITDRVDRVIKEARIKVYRQDFNFDPGPIFEANDGPDRTGIHENLHVQGYYAFWDSLLERNPGLIIDSCSSGGRRNEIETMKRAVPLHYTDVGYGKHTIKQKQHREMFEWIPYFRAHTLSWDTPDGTYGYYDHPVDEFAYQNAFTPAVASTVGWNDSEEHFELGRRMEPVWRKAAELELSADYYPLTKCRKDASDWYAVQFDGQEEGFIQVIRNIQVKEDTYRVRPIVPDPECHYLFTDPLSDDLFFITGKELQKHGFKAVLAPRSGRIWFYEKY